MSLAHIRRIAKGLPSALPRVPQAGRDGTRREVVTTSQISRFWAYGAAFMVGAGILAGNDVLFGLGMLLLGTIGVAWLWTRHCLRNLTVHRRFNQTRAFFGEEVDMALVFTNAKPLPVPWLGVEDQYPGTLQLVRPDGQTPAVRATTKHLSSVVSLGWYERVTRHYKFRCTARGEHSFGPVVIESGDVFGLFRRTETISTPHTLIVYPRYVPVERLGIPARQPFGDFKAMQHLATDPLRIRSVREYAYGDNPRHIHWKATARRGALQTKLFEPAATPQLFIFCNQDTFTRMWEGIDPETLDLTITVAASLANHALEQGYMVGLQVNAFSASSDRQVRILPSRNPNQLTRILEALARIRGWSGLPMEDLIRAERRNLPIACTIVVVTGVVTDDLLDILVALRRAGHPVTLVETIGSHRAASWARHASAEALDSQGIVYYRVESIGEASKVEALDL
jgi:uncharacterized protein (DUF58 family)